MRASNACRLRRQHRRANGALPPLSCAQRAHADTRLVLPRCRAHCCRRSAHHIAQTNVPLANLKIFFFAIPPILTAHEKKRVSKRTEPCTYRRDARAHTHTHTRCQSQQDARNKQPLDVDSNERHNATHRSCCARFDARGWETQHQTSSHVSCRTHARTMHVTHSCQQRAVGDTAVCLSLTSPRTVSLSLVVHQ